MNPYETATLLTPMMPSGIADIKAEVNAVGREIKRYGNLDNTPDELQQRYAELWSQYDWRTEDDDDCGN